MIKKDVIFLKICRTNEQTEQFICNCTKMRTFGVLCEYQFSQNRFESTILSQYTQKGRYPLGSQLFGTTTCYKTSFPCDYGTICLEWRNICDGKYRVFLKPLPQSVSYILYYSKKI